MSSTIRAALAGLLLGLTLPSLAAGIEMPASVMGGNNTGIGFGGEDGKPDIVILVVPHQIDGMLAVCGIVIVDTKNGNLRRAEKSITRQVRFELLGQHVRFRTADLLRFGGEDEAKAAGKVGCSVSKLPWQPAYAAAKIAFPGGSIRYTDQ